MERYTQPVCDWTTSELLDAWRGRKEDGHPPAPTADEALEGVRGDIEQILATKPLEAIPSEVRNKLAVMLDYTTYALMRRELILRAYRLNRGADDADDCAENLQAELNFIKNTV